LSLMNYRGADASNCIYELENYKLGYHRLNAKDLVSDNNQLFFSPDKRYCVIFDGRIYNLKELQKENKLIATTQSDAEILIKLYIKYKSNMLSMLNGMFAFIIFDVHKKQFFAARDRLGVKPLYFYAQGNQFIFSSEIRPILELAGKVTIDDVAERQYRMMRNFFNGRTIYNEIKEFPAGCYMENCRIKTYWNLDIKYDDPPSDEELKELIISSIKYRNTSDINVGSYLSGGIDSTIISYLSESRHTYTVGFKEYNEFMWSDLAASKLLNSTNHKTIIDKDEFIDIAKKIITTRKEPLLVPNTVLIYKMNKEVKKQSEVILSGEGADELFYGYDRIFNWANRVDEFDIIEFSRYYCYGSKYDYEVINDALKPFYRFKKPILIVAAFFQIAHLKGLLSRLDLATVMCSVEGRTPFVDYRLVQRLFGLDFNYKHNNGIVKAPLKRIFSDKIPPEIIQRRKVGFPVPLNEVFNTQDQDSFYDEWFDFNMKTLRRVL
ncbi:MAG: asparagine synthase (glutamine-hydrolyzing), partial [Clostridiaceae bacterium]|nr:asparagine synthase (glutamine-hydrolyzing) [Clostridiaceae bacterium]